MRNLGLVAILVVAFFARLSLLTVAWGHEDRVLTPDSRDYLDLADAMHRHEGFALYDPTIPPSASRRPAPLIPQIFRTPGYPAFLLVWRGLPGRWWSAVFAQVMLDTLLVLVTFRLGRQFVSRGAALLAAGLQAISPLAIASSCRVLSDGLYALLLTTALLLIIRHIRSGSWWALLASAGLLAAACYVRPVGLAMAGIFAAVLLFRPKRIRRTAAFAGIVLAAVAPWVARNIIVADYWGFSSFATDSLFRFAAPKVMAKTQPALEKEVLVLGPDGELTRGRVPAENVARDRMVTEGRRALGLLATPGAVARYRRDRAMEVILAHPWTYARVHLGGCVGFFLPGAADFLEVAGVTTGQRGTLEVLQTRGLWAAVRHYVGGNWAAVVLAAPFVLILLGKYAAVAVLAARKLRWRMPAEAWLLVLVAAASALLPGPAAHPRFRVPVEPLLSITAAAGAMMLLRRKSDAPDQAEQDDVPVAPVP